MLSEKLKNHRIILASGSPRRQEFLRNLGLDFEIRTKKVEESYPEAIETAEIAAFLAHRKAEAYLPELRPQDILITGDTIVRFEDRVIHKPQSPAEARKMLSELSGQAHQVISAAQLTALDKRVSVSQTTEVFFKTLTDEEIDFYVKNYRPYDKAGAYGIQEWIGLIGISKIYGSFYNVMGMPVDLVYDALKNW